MNFVSRPATGDDRGRWFLFSQMQKHVADATLELDASRLHAITSVTRASEGDVWFDVHHDGVRYRRPRDGETPDLQNRRWIE